MTILQDRYRGKRYALIIRGVLKGIIVPIIGFEMSYSKDTKIIVDIRGYCDCNTLTLTTPSEAVVIYPEYLGMDGELKTMYEIEKEIKDMPTKTCDYWDGILSLQKSCMSSSVSEKQTINKDNIELVNFNDKKGTTVIKWKDGTISKVKVQLDKGDTYNHELGMAMCIAKKALGNKGNFNEVFKKWLPEGEE